MIDAQARYSIDLWDHDKQAWSRRLANRFVGSCSRLSPRGLVRALRQLRQHSWGECAIFVERKEATR